MVEPVWLWLAVALHLHAMVLHLLQLVVLQFVLVLLLHLLLVVLPNCVNRLHHIPSYSSHSTDLVAALDLVLVVSREPAVVAFPMVGVVE